MNQLNHKNFNLTLSDKRTACLWENTMNGTATIICGKQFEPLKALHVLPRSKAIICGASSLIPVKIGHHIMEVSTTKQDSYILLYKIIGIYKKTTLVKAVLIHSFILSNKTIQYTEFLNKILFVNAQTVAINKSKGLLDGQYYYAIKPRKNKKPEILKKNKISILK